MKAGFCGNLPLMIEENKMSRILCSTGALIGRPNGRDYHILSDLINKLDCDGFEFMLYSSWYDEVEEIRDYLLSLKIDIPVMHCEKHIGEKISIGGGENINEAIRLFKINCQMAKDINAEKMVMHLWDGGTSDWNFNNNLETYGILKNIADGYGIDLLVENVVCSKENPMKHWCELAEKYPDVHFIFDTKMAAFHEQEELLYSNEYEWLWKEKHIRHYHINDYNGGYMEWSKLKTLPIGQGHIDFKKFFRFIRKINYNDTFTVEATAFREDGSVDTEMLNGCFRKIRDI